MTNTFGDFDAYNTEGVVEFTLDGRTLLRPFTTRPRRCYIVFKDASSGGETYSAARLPVQVLAGERAYPEHLELPAS